MKNLNFFGGLILGLLFLSSCSSAEKLQTLSFVGAWELVQESDSLNQQSSRYLIFTNDGEFESLRATPIGHVNYNKGTFVMADEKTIITIHVDHRGQRFNTANQYQISVENDTLTLKGYYVPPVTNSFILRAGYVDEKWVRSELEAVKDAGGSFVLLNN